MAWNTDYGRDYTRSWFGRGGGRDFDPGWHEHMSRGGPYRASPQYGFDYERQFRRPPEQSPTFGRGGDREVRRWAREHGYDEGFEIRPQEGRWGAAPTYGGEFRRPGPTGWRGGYGWESGRSPWRWQRGYQW
jgi:hypothetical protein